MPVNMRTRIIAFLFLAMYYGAAFPQCCSTGSPVGASVYVGVLEKNSLRFIGYYRHNYSDSYYQGESRTTENNQLSHSSYNFTGLTIGYGITKRLTLETDFGYFINKTQVFSTIDYQETGYGLSNGGVTLKYGALLIPAKQIELTAGAGFRYPFSSKPQEIDGVQLSRDVQPSTNAFAVSGMLFFNKGFPSLTMRVFTINRYDHNFADPLNYKYGDLLLNSLFVSKQIVKNFLGIIQVRSEYRQPDQDTHEVRVNTGNWLLLVVPQLSYAIAGKWNLSVLCDIPVYKNYTGKQLTPTYSFAMSLSRDINLTKSQKNIPEIKSAN
jgi:hypothetical protein